MSKERAAAQNKTEVWTRQVRDGIWFFGRVGNTPFKAKIPKETNKKALTGTNVTYLLAYPNLLNCTVLYPAEDAVFENGSWIAAPKSEAAQAALIDLIRFLKTQSEPLLP